MDYPKDHSLFGLGLPGSNGKHIKKPWLFRVYRGIILPSYMGIIINRVFFFVAHMKLEYKECIPYQF